MLGLGAFAASPATALDITSSEGLNYFNTTSDSSKFSVNSSGALEVKKAGTASNKIETIYSKTLDTEDVTVEADGTGSAGLRIEAQDLSSLSLNQSYHNFIFHHDGSSQITLTDSSTTTSSGLYIWDNTNDGWIPTQKDAISVGGYSADQLAKRNGDTFTGTLTVQPDAGNSLLQLLTEAGTTDESRLHLGGDQTAGGRLVFHPDNDNFEIGYYKNNVFSPVIRFDETTTPLELLPNKLKAKDVQADELQATGMIIESNTEATDLTVKNRGSGDQDAFLYLDYDDTGEVGMRIQKNNSTLWRIESGDAFNQDLHFRDTKTESSPLELERDGDVVMRQNLDMRDNIIYSVDTLDVDEDSRDTAHTALEFDINNTAEAEQIYESVTSISTTSQSIATIDKGGLILVYGENNADATVYFQDLLLAVDSGGVTTIASQGNNSPASRSYSMNGNTLELAMGADTYNVTKMLFVMRTTV